MAALPYITSPGSIDKALIGIKNAALPERVSQDFVKTILKVPGGSGDQITAFLKKLGLANADGSPSELYKKFRNPTVSGSAIATAIRSAYAPLYVRNEFMHELKDADLLGLIVEETGQAHDSGPVKLIFACLKRLKSFADFSSKPDDFATPPPPSADFVPATRAGTERSGGTSSFGLNLGYTINLNLPATSDPAVFDAIFRSLKEHLLRDSDG